MTGRLQLLAPAACCLLLMALAVGCTKGRFDDAGCETDENCRFERVCVAGQCVSPEMADRLLEDAGGDAGGDAGDDVGDTLLDASIFVGLWNMEVDGETRAPDGSVQELDGEEMIVEIQAGSGADLEILLENLGEFCPVKADLVDQRKFEILDEDCTFTPEGTTQTVRDMRGRGVLDSDGTLEFTFAATVEGSTDDQPNMTASFDFEFEGERIDAVEPGGQ